MARNRQIKVEFWADEKIGKLSFLARLLFIGIWNFSDDSGVCRANPIYLKNELFPYDKFNYSRITVALHELYSSGLITELLYKNESYLYVNNFRRHQLINKPSKLRLIPDLNDDYRSITIGLQEDSLPNVNVNVNENVKEKDIFVHSDGADFRDKFNLLFQYWNKQNIIVHRKPTKGMVNEFRKWYKQNVNIQKTIDCYVAILKSEKTFWNYKWGLKEFLARGVNKFLDMTVEDAIDNFRRKN